MSAIYTFRCGRTTVRPIIVDQHISTVTVLAESYADAMEAAANMVACRSGVEMVTSTEWCP